MTAKPPIPASAVPDDWIHACRHALSVTEGVQIRANPTQPSIDVWSVNRSRWMPLMLFGSGTLFASFDDRNIILQKLTSK